MRDFDWLLNGRRSPKPLLEGTSWSAGEFGTEQIHARIASLDRRREEDTENRKNHYSRYRDMEQVKFRRAPRNDRLRIRLQQPAGQKKQWNDE